jgi:GxxExxY protein
MNEGGKWQQGGADEGGLDELIYRVIGCMIAVHKELGPGFEEHIYHRALELELAHHGIHFESEVEIELTYRGKHIGKQRLDLLVENRLVVELKAVEDLHKKHYAQVRSYLKAAGKPVGLLANLSDFQLDPRRVELNRSK